MKVKRKKTNLKKVLLSFDIEEFDVPFEYGKVISFADQISISLTGTEIILEILDKHQIKATFFSTVAFAANSLNVIGRIVSEKHELASHGWFHSRFEKKHLLESRLELERISGQSINGFRMARMMPVESAAICAAGYQYNSSLNPVYLPGRYNNFFKPRTLFYDKLIQIPASATPLVRVPLFWLSFHNLPQDLYRLACLQTMNTDKYLNVYFHPWEFTDLNQEKFGLPKMVSRNTGAKMIERFDSLIRWMKDQGYQFSTISDFVESELKLDQ